MTRYCAVSAVVQIAPTDQYPGMGTRLKDLRKARGLTQEQLADLSGIERTKLTRMEGGRLSIRDHDVYLLARAMKVHPGEIFAPLPAFAALDFPEMDENQARQLQKIAWSLFGPADEDDKNDHGVGAKVLKLG